MAGDRPDQSEAADLAAVSCPGDAPGPAGVDVADLDGDLSAAAADPAEARALWQLKRRRPAGEYRGGRPMAGFGPAGEMTLWVPPSRLVRRVVFRAGRPVMLTEDPGSAELSGLRDRALGSFAAVGPGVAEIDLAFMEYTAAVLSQNYVLSDEDLGFLLGGTDWHDAMMRHLLGGENAVAALFERGGMYLALLSAEAHGLDPEAVARAALGGGGGEPAIDATAVLSAAGERPAELDGPAPGKKRARAKGKRKAAPRRRRRG